MASLATVFAVTLPFRRVQLATLDTFVPIVNTVGGLNDLITALLLYTQFAAARKRGLLALAAGYLFSGLLLIPYQLVFPGAFAPTGLLGANLQTAPWLYLSHMYAIVIGAIMYAMDDSDYGASSPNARRIGAAIARNAALVTALVIFVTWFATARANLLPPIMRDSLRPSSAFDPIRSTLQITSTLLIIIVFRRRRASILDLWLQVALVSWALELVLAAIVPARFSLVFYVARSMGVVCSSVVLVALLVESMTLHSRLALAMAARHHEREGRRTAIDVIIGSIAHELRQPLAAIAANGIAGARLSESVGTGPDELREIFDEIQTSALRAGEILKSISALASASATEWQSIDVNDVVRQSVKMVKMDLDAAQVEVRLDLTPELTPIHGHRGQLIQVLVNGLTNALDSIAQVRDRPRQLDIRTAPRPDGGVSILIEDCGAGIDADVRDRVFDPFYSTKAAGMGLGLSICQSIVNAHGGALSLDARPGQGAVFRVDLPNLAPAEHRPPARDQYDSRLTRKNRTPAG